MLEIRRSTDAHLLATLSEEIHKMHHSWHPEIFKPYNREAIQRYIEALFEKGTATAFIAFNNEIAAGYCIVNMAEHKENAFSYARKILMVDQFHVLNQYRRQGIGSKLMKAVEVLAKELQINRLELNHWTDNEIARAFFNSIGFNYYNEKMYLQVE